ncbi:MAG: dihydroneopterin aldolase [Alphaproteobacteria bacterium]|nr:dihydroneopterin aldolase [Alphaproteobacteria bacterium]
MLTKATQPGISDSQTALETRRTVFLRGLRLDAWIGAYEFEAQRRQPIVIDIAIDVISPAAPVNDDLGGVLCYDRVHRNVRSLLAAGHIKLVETLAERIATSILEHPLAIAVTVRVEKPSAVPAADGVGVEIRREKKSVY